MSVLVSRHFCQVRTDRPEVSSSPRSSLDLSLGSKARLMRQRSPQPEKAGSVTSLILLNSCLNPYGCGCSHLTDEEPGFRGITYIVYVPKLTSGGAGTGPQMCLAPELEPFIPTVWTPSSLWGGASWLL